MVAWLHGTQQTGKIRGGRLKQRQSRKPIRAVGTRWSTGPRHGLWGLEPRPARTLGSSGPPRRSSKEIWWRLYGGVCTTSTRYVQTCGDGQSVVSFGSDFRLSHRATSCLQGLKSWLRVSMFQCFNVPCHASVRNQPKAAVMTGLWRDCALMDHR